MLMFGLTSTSCTPTADTQPSSTTAAPEPGPEPSADPPSPQPSAPSNEPKSGEPGDAIAIDDGFDFACALQRAGTVACWGRNVDGQLGQLHREVVDGAVLVQGLDDAVALALSHSAACVARRSGSVSCWGSAKLGQLGNGSEQDHRGFVEVPGVRDATALFSGSHTYCAITASGPWCWGSPASLHPVQEVRDFAHQYDAAPLPLDGVRALHLGNRHAYAYREDGSAWQWDMKHDPVAVQGIVEANSRYERECLVHGSGEVTCHDDAERVIESLRGARHLFLSSSFIAGILSDGSLAGETLSPASPLRFEDAHDLVALTSGDDDELHGLRSDGRVFVWERNGATMVAREIPLPSPSTLTSAKAAESLPEAPVPSRCKIETKVVQPVDVEPLQPDRSSLCSSVRIHSDSSDCPETGPWFERKSDDSIALVVPLGAGQFGRIPELAWYSDGTEESSLITGLQVRSSNPVEAWLLMSAAEAGCEGEGEDELCGLSSTHDQHIVVTGQADGSFLVTRVTIDMHTDKSQLRTAARVSVSGEMLDVWVCGGHARVARPAAEPSSANPTLPGVSADEAATAAKRCAQGWSSFQAGQLADAKLEIDAALTVLERARDDKGRRSFGACLYNRGRIAEQEGNVADARDLYRRSLAARPNDTVSARLDSLGPE
jgi:hypothetical protein